MIKTKSSLFSILGLALIINALNPSQTMAQSGWEFKSIYLNSGLLSNSTLVSTDKSDFQTLAPESSFFNENINNFNLSSAHFLFDVDNLQNYWAGFEKPLGKGRLVQEIRIGMTMGNIRLIGGDFRNEVITTIDTLIIQSNQAKYPVDSVYTKSYKFMNETSTLMLDVSYMIKGRDFGRFNFYGGLGLGLGLNFRSQTSVFIDENFGIEFQNPSFESDLPSFNYYNSNYIDSQSEIFDSRGSFMTRLYVPLGISLQLGRNNNFWKHLSLFVETAPGIFITRIPDLSRNIVMPHSYNSFGLKINLFN